MAEPRIANYCIKANVQCIQANTETHICKYAYVRVYTWTHIDKHMYIQTQRPIYMYIQTLTLRRKTTREKGSPKMRLGKVVARTVARLSH